MRAQFAILTPDGAGTFLHLDGRVQGDMQLGVLVQVVFCCLGCGWVFGGGVVWGALRVTVQAHFAVQGACSLGCCCRCCFGMLFGVLLEVLVMARVLG